MTTIHRRQISTGPRSFLDRTEETRIDDRARLFRELAQRKEREASLRSLEAALRELDSAADAAADEHNAAAEPLQSELAEPDISPARRTKLLGELAKLNEVLESKIASVKSIRSPIAVQKQEIQALVSSAAAIEGSIARSAPLADQAASWASLRGLRYSQERLTAATKSERIASDELKLAQAQPGVYDIVQFTRRHLQWSFEVTSASRMLEHAKAENELAQAKLTDD